jgi:hypothetical protein
MARFRNTGSDLDLFLGEGCVQARMRGWGLIPQVRAEGDGQSAGCKLLPRPEQNEMARVQVVGQFPGEG